MKINKRLVPLDLISIDKGDQRIVISTHRHSVILSSYEDYGKKPRESHEFTFDQLFKLIQDLKPGIQSILTP
jgi:hypothetical protein